MQITCDRGRQWFTGSWTSDPHSATQSSGAPIHEIKGVKGGKFRRAFAVRDNTGRRLTLKRKVASTLQPSTCSCTLHLEERPKNPATRMRLLNMSGSERRKPAYVSFIDRTQDENTATKKRKSAATTFRG